MNKGEMLAYGSFQRGVLDALTQTAQQAAFSLHAVSTIEDASRFLESSPTQALVIAANDAAGLAVLTRSSTRYAQIPMIALCRELSDLSFTDAFSWGADDAVQMDALRPLLTRLRSLPRQPLTHSAHPRGNALVAELDQTRRIVVGRVLRNAGYSVTFAVTPDDAITFAARSDLALGILTRELVSDPRACIELARAAGSSASFIVCCPPREFKHERASLAGLSAVGVVDAFAPPENMLFAANELRGGFANNRASPRILYGTTVAFRGAGKERDDYGFSYNISAGGLYVRTLAPPEDNELWLELCAPRSERRVRLVAEVAWRRRFGPSENATVPPGFGVRIVDGAKSDLEHWQATYNEVSQALG